MGQECGICHSGRQVRGGKCLRSCSLLLLAEGSPFSVVAYRLPDGRTPTPVFFPSSVAFAGGTSPPWLWSMLL